jgi:hypothetical protein
MKRIPKQDLAIPEYTAADVWAAFQRKGRTTDDDECIIPSEALKDNPDYWPGPVKVYTKEEVAQYEEDRDE